MIRIIRLTILIVVFGISAYFTFTVKFIRTGSIVEIRKDEIVVRGESMHEPDYVLPIEEKSRFYDSRGNNITFSELKKGNRVRVKLFPRTYGGIFLVREKQTIRWMKVLSEE